MKLDILYEVDAPKPWNGDHPKGQREREQRAYYEAIEQIKLADSLGFNTIWAGCGLVGGIGKLRVRPNWFSMFTK